MKNTRHYFTHEGRILAAPNGDLLGFRDDEFDSVAESFDGTFPKGVKAHHVDDPTVDSPKIVVLREMYEENGSVSLENALTLYWYDPLAYIEDLIRTLAN